MRLYGMMALLTLVSHFTFIAVAFYMLQGLRLDRFFPPEQQWAVRLLVVLGAVALGFTCSQFFLSFITNVRNLGYLL
ncbi:DUF1146 family protein [Ligilactobacillus hohenheimensis]|uniref:DUF1146 family protein n=1 Tax=Ligilactobacillus hohenheimensis TaxID=2991832 RepID=UPI0024BBB650|nr:DUF1146 family protein [Ligilactobacillus hohenheimensis]